MYHFNELQMWSNPLILLKFHILHTCSWRVKLRVPKHRKWGNSRVIKGSTAYFQGYFWKTVVTLLYVNNISSNFSHLFQDFFWVYMQHSKEVSIIFLKNGWWQNSMKFREKKRYLCWSIFCLSQIFKGIPGFYTKFQAIFRVQGSKINSRLFKAPWEPCKLCLSNVTNHMLNTFSMCIDAWRLMNEDERNIFTFSSVHVREQQKV